MQPAHPDRRAPTLADVWKATDARIAELLAGGPPPTDVEDTRYAEYQVLLEIFDQLEYLAGQEYLQQRREQLGW